MAFYKSVLRDVQPDMIYLNSFFDRAFSIAPFLALGRGKSTPMLVTPRGEFSPGALSLKSIRKQTYLLLARQARLYGHIYWHACSEPEAHQIRNLFSTDGSHLFLASNMPGPANGYMLQHDDKLANRLRIVVVSRVVPMKNTLAAIRIASHLRGEVTLDIWGIIEDASYWNACQRQIAHCPSNVKVYYRGEIAHEQLSERLRDYDVMLLPTLGENFGHAIVEALMAGLPVIISDRTPWRNLASAGVGADLPIDNEDAFVQTLLRYQAMTEKEMAQERHKCRSYVAAWRSANQNLNDYQKMFKAVMASGRMPLCRVIHG
ncbi:glycosyltransferase family 4 protein [Nitrospira moscoviensis]|nr:glycosyltransferase family 4 protein [Nitrospira moscoviensis]